MDKQIYAKIGFCIVLLVVFISGSPLYAQFAGGSGTAADPYLVQTAEHLNNVRNYQTAHFLQTANIDLNVAPYNQGDGWMPIGDISDNFRGVYDGGGFFITNLYIISMSYPEGLFGEISAAVLKRIQILNADITVGGSGGILAGNSSHSEIMNCKVSGTLSGGIALGGLVGFVEYSTIHSCQVSANLSGGNQFVGGICSRARYSSISQCTTTGSISENDSAGGIAGYLYTSTVSDCYSRIDFSGGGTAAGVVYYMQLSSIRNSYYSGEMSNQSERYGVFGIPSGESESVVSCYWDMQTSGTSISNGGEGRTTAQMTYPYAENTYVGWDFFSRWIADTEADQNNGYPYMMGFNPLGVVVRPEISQGSGCFASSFQVSISTPTTGAVIHYTLDGRDPTIASAIYTAPLTISASTTLKAFAVYPGFVNSTVSTAVYYIGLFAGGDGSESDPFLVSSPQQLDAVRLAPNACFKQICNIDLNVEPYNSGEGWSPIGDDMMYIHPAFTGVYDGGSWKISNLYIARNSADHPVGLFGAAWNAELRNVNLTNVNIHGNRKVGGLIGLVRSVTLSRISVRGEIHGYSRIGGLVGDATWLRMSDCYSRASVEGEFRVGGLIGDLNVDNSVIEYCYSTGAVICTGSNCGGIAGSGGQSGSYIYSIFWDIETSGQATSPIGLGMTTDHMTYPYGTNCYYDWSFGSVWLHDVAYHNDGYPYFYNRVDTPMITYPEPVQGNSVLVTITGATDGAWYYYTLDGSDPDEGSTPYSGPFQVISDEDSLVVVKAIGYREDFEPSEIASHTINFGSGSAVSDTDTPEIALQMTAYPNPVRDVLSLRLNLPQAEHTKLMIYNLRGQLIKVLQDSVLRAGEHSLSWDRRDVNGARVAPGIYFINVETTGTSKTHKILVIE